MSAKWPGSYRRITCIDFDPLGMNLVLS